MAHNEASFKLEFRKALAREYGVSLKIWPHFDAATSGLPDIGSHWDGRFYPMEVKFAKAAPKRDESKVLKHELSEVQEKFLRDIWCTSGNPIILVGFPDIAVAVPYSKWPYHLCDTRANLNERIGNPNISLEEIQAVRRLGLSFEKHKGIWDVAGFYESVSKW